MKFTWFESTKDLLRALGALALLILLIFASRRKKTYIETEVFKDDIDKEEEERLKDGN